MTKRLNILMMNYEYPPLGGGGGVFNKQLAEELGKRHNVTVITSQFSAEPPHEVKNGVEISRVPIIFRNDQNAASLPSMLSFFPASLKSGYSLLKKKRFDIIHSFFAIPTAPSGLVLSKIYSVPHVLSILGGDVYDPSKKLSPHRTPLLHYTVQKMIAGSDKVVSLSSDIKNRAMEYYKVEKEIEIIHLGIPKPVYKKKMRSDFGLKPDDILLITVGRLVQRKSIEELIKTINDLQNPHLKLIVIGDGPEREKLAGLAKSLQVIDQILFFGYVSNEQKFELLALSDIYVSSSQHEGFGIVFLEAMAMGLPVICYDNGGQAEFLINEKTGFLVDQGDNAMLADKIKTLAAKSELRIEMGQFNLRYIEQFYIESCSNRYQEIYRSSL